MAKRRVNIIILSFIILCSTSFYKLKLLGGPVQKVAELMGAGVILLMIILYLVYSDQKSIRQHYVTPIILIFLSMLTSMVMAYVIHEQKFMLTLFAQRALYYYLLYFLLHQLRFHPGDLQKIIIFFGLVYVGLYLIQVVLYPNVIFDAYVRQDRGTIRIYLPGSGFMAATFYIVLQRFLRSNKFIYLIISLLILSIYVMTGGRQSLAIVIFVTILFILIDTRVRSRILLIFLGMIAAMAIFFMFQQIFLELFTTSKEHMAMGDEYIRIRAARYYLTDFFKTPVAYITGNGMYYPHSQYGRLIFLNSLVHNYHLGDIGLIGNYAMYGIFFVLGVFIICIRSMRMKISSEHTYIKYMFLGVILSLFTSGGFGDPAFISFIIIILFLIDTSNKKQSNPGELDVEAIEKERVGAIMGNKIN
jgi:hypothetical protein